MEQFSHYGISSFVMMLDYGYDLPYTLKMARKEAEMGIIAICYFAHTTMFSNQYIIREIADLGYRIGYIRREVGGDSYYVKKLAKLRQITSYKNECCYNLWY